MPAKKYVLLVVDNFCLSINIDITIKIIDLTNDPIHQF